MTSGHVAGRRRRFSGRSHDLRERDTAAEVRRISYRVPGATPDEAVVEAKHQAKAEGWILRTVTGCKPAEGRSGEWLVTFAAVHD